MKELTKLAKNELQSVIDTNINCGKPEQLFDLLKSILETGDREMLAFFCVRLMVNSDLDDFAMNPKDLERVLVSDGWRAYENQTIDQNIEEFLNREGDLEYYFEDFAVEIPEII